MQNAEGQYENKFNFFYWVVASWFSYLNNNYTNGDSNNSSRKIILITVFIIMITITIMIMMTTTIQIMIIIISIQFNSLLYHSLTSIFIR